MGKVTFVVDFEDGKEPAISLATEILGGRLSAVLWADYRDDFFTQEQAQVIESALDASSNGDSNEGRHLDIINKIGLMTL